MDKELEAEIELIRKSLRGNLEKKEKEAEEKMQEILSKEKMEFCSRCNKKISDRSEWSGKCLGKDCNNLICNKCWLIDKKRLCREHAERVFGKETEDREKTFFKVPEPTAKAIPELKIKDDDKSRDRVDELTNKFIDKLKDRFKDNIPNWTTREFFEDRRIKIEIGDEEMNAVVYTKQLLKDNPKIKIIVRPFYEKDAESLEYLADKIVEDSEFYTLIVLVGDSCMAGAANFVQKFEHPRVSLFLVQPAQGLLYSDAKDATKFYEPWFDLKGRPKNFKSILKSISEKVSNKYVINLDRVSKEFGLTEGETIKLLETCKFLEPVEGTYNYFFRA